MQLFKYFTFIYVQAMMYRNENDIFFEELKSMERNNEGQVATVLYKDKDVNEEKCNPSEKLWLIVKYINTSLNFSSRGYKIKIGDILKFGRVRFKVIMLQNDVDGELVYKPEKPAKNREQVPIPSQENTESEQELEQNLDQPNEDFGFQPARSYNAQLHDQSLQREEGTQQDYARQFKNQRSLKNKGLKIQTQIDPTKQGSQLKQIDKKVSDKSQNQQICRICLGDENTQDDPLITPCKCDGTMKHIHIECLREWLKSKRTFKENYAVKTYCWKALECELCKVRFPDRITSDEGKFIELTQFDKPNSHYLVLESVTQQNIKIIHVINMQHKDFIKVGRGHDSEVRVTDISVSRCHALIKVSSKGDYVVEDNSSKFGTLVQVRKPMLLSKFQLNHFQLGRTVVNIGVKDPQIKWTLTSLCCGQKSNKVQKGIMANEGDDYFPEEFVQKIVEFTREEDLIRDTKKMITENQTQPKKSNNGFEIVTENQLQGFDDPIIANNGQRNSQQELFLVNNYNEENQEEEEDRPNELENSQSQLNPSRRASAMTYNHIHQIQAQGQQEEEDKENLESIQNTVQNKSKSRDISYSQSRLQKYPEQSLHSVQSEQSIQTNQNLNINPNLQMEAPPIQVLDFHNVFRNQEEENKQMLYDTSRIDPYQDSVTQQVLNISNADYSANVIQMDQSQEEIRTIVNLQPTSIKQQNRKKQKQEAQGAKSQKLNGVNYDQIDYGINKENEDGVADSSRVLNPNENEVVILQKPQANSQQKLSENSQDLVLDNFSDQRGGDLQLQQLQEMD